MNTLLALCVFTLSAACGAYATPLSRRAVPFVNPVLGGGGMLDNGELFLWTHRVTSASLWPSCTWIRRAT